MAENERLDVGNRRFRWVVADLLRGLSPPEIAGRIVRNLCGAWNLVRRNGFDVANVLELAGAGADMNVLVRGTGGSDLAHLIETHSLPFDLPAGILDKANRTAIEMVIESGLQQACCDVNGPDVLRAAAIKAEVMAAAEPAIESLTNVLLGGRQARVRLRPPVAATSTPPVSLPLPPDILRQSMLPAGARQPYGGQP